MMKKTHTKNDKIKIFLICFLIYAFLSWIVPASTYQSGQLVDVGMYRAGLYDLIAVIFSGITYKIEDILYLLSVGGMYGILIKTETYKRMVWKTSDFVRKNGEISFLIITLLISLYTAMTSNIITLFIVVPFIMSVFLKGGYDKLTAISASFGGLFLGYIGQIFGTYGNEFLYQYLSVVSTTEIMVKIIIFIIVFALYNVFGIYHLKKNNNGILEENDDMYAVDELAVITKKRDRILNWPTIVAVILSLIIIMIGYIPWSEALNITIFDKFHTSLMEVSIGGINIFEILIGATITALGTWSDFLPAMLVMFVAMVVIVITNRMSFSDVCQYFIDGLKKMVKVAAMYGIAFAFLYMTTAYPWPTSLINSLIKIEAYNIIFILLALIAAVLAIILCGDPLFSGYYYGQYLGAIFTVNMGITAIIWRVGSAIGLLFGPTSFLLLTVLVYADVPYIEWLKYIWKFLLACFVAILLLLGIVII